MSKPITSRILVITLSNIGDVVMTTPVFEALHAHYPDAVIDIVADRRSDSLFRFCPYKGQVFIKDKKLGWSGVVTLIREIRKQHYDLVVDLRTDGLAYLLKTNRRLWKWPRRYYGEHAVDSHMSVIQPVHKETPFPAATVWLDKNTRQYAKDLLQELPGKRWVGIGPGANWAGKIWPKEAFLEMAEIIKSDVDGFVLLGGPGDQESCSWLAEKLSVPTVDLCAKTDLLQVGAVLEKVLCFVGNDSGLGHIAAAVGARVLTVFGPGQPQRYHPWGDKTDWIVAQDRDLDSLKANIVATRLQALLDY